MEIVKEGWMKLFKGILRIILIGSIMVFIALPCLVMMSLVLGVATLSNPMTIFKELDSDTFQLRGAWRDLRDYWESLKY